MRQLHVATIEELLGELFPMQSVPRCYQQDWSRIKLVLRQSPGNKDVNKEVDGSTALEADTRQRLLKTQQTGKT
jgi:hypothetical protein